MKQEQTSPVVQQKTFLESGLQTEDKILDLAGRLDFTNIQILRKFYATGETFPNDTKPHVFSVLYMEMKNSQSIPIGVEALRKRMDSLVSAGLLLKIGRTSPACYYPVKGIEQSVRAVIKRFMMNNGLSHVP